MSLKSLAAGHLALVATLVVLAGCLQAALAKPQLTFSSSSSEDNFGHVTETKHNVHKTVAGQHQSGFLRQAKRGESASRAAKPAEAVLLFDGPLKGLIEIPIVKELSSLLLPRLEEMLKNIDAETKVVVKKPEQSDKYEGESPLEKKKRKDKELGHLLSDVGKVVFGSKSDGSDGLLTDEKVGISKILQGVGQVLPLPALGGVVSSVGKFIDNVKPLNRLNQFGGGLVKGARSSQEPPTYFNRLLEDALAGESQEETTRLFKNLNALLEEGTFLGKNKNQGQGQQQQQQQQEEEQEEGQQL